MESKSRLIIDHAVYWQLNRGFRSKCGENKDYDTLGEGPHGELEARLPSVPCRQIHINGVPNPSIQSSTMTNYYCMKTKHHEGF